jgi:hypothetical protein
LLKKALPETYEKFVVEQPGSRRFLIKWGAKSWQKLNVK